MQAISGGAASLAGLFANGAATARSAYSICMTVSQGASFLSNGLQIYSTASGMYNKYVVNGQEMQYGEVFTELLSIGLNVLGMRDSGKGFANGVKSIKAEHAAVAKSVPAGNATEGSTNLAHNVAQYERLKSSYAADEIMNAERVGSALKDDPAHRAASFLSKEQLASGKTFSFTGG